MTVVMGMKSSDTQGMLLNGQSTAERLGRWQAGATSTDTEHSAGGSVSYRADGASIPALTRGELDDAFADGDWHVASITSANLSSWTAAGLGFYSASSGWNAAYDITYLAIFPSDADTLALNEQLAAQVSGVTLP